MYRLNRSLAAAILVPTLLGMGCEFVAGIKERAETQRVMEAGLPEAGSDAPMQDGPEGCLARPPAPPSEVDAAGNDREFVVAFRSVDFGDSPAQIAELGFDLDGVDTRCDAGVPAPSCLVPSSAKDTPPAWCDGTCGRDHGGNLLMLDLRSQISGAQLTKDMEAGRVGLLLRVTGYNGSANDDFVTVHAFVSAGVLGYADGGSPQWNGTDEWQLIHNFAHLNGQQLFSIGPSSGYVSNSVLVAQDFDSVTGFQLGFAGDDDSVLVLRLLRTVLSATMVVDGGAVSLTDGRIGGVASIQDVLSLVMSVPHCPDNPNDPIFPLAKGATCPRADIMGDGQLNDPARGCNALALGLGFTAEPAVLSTTLQDISVVATPKCGDAGSGPPPAPCP
jgi:hypothetical protein